MESPLLKSRGFWIGIAFSAACVGIFVYTSDVRHPSKLRHAFSDVNYAWIAASLPVYYLALWVRTVRWQYFLRPVKKVSAIRLYPVVIIGLMANNLIPARAGELARAYVLGQREKISKTTTLGTIAVDRVFDGMTLIPMLLIVGALASGDTTFTVGWRWFTVDLNLAGLGAVMAALFGAALAVLFYLTLSTRGRVQLHGLIHRFAPASAKPKVEGLIDAFLEGLAALRNPIDLGLALMMSVASWTLEALMYYLVARGFGIHEGFHIFLLLTAAANLAIAVVATQGGVGAFELVVSKTIVAFAVTSAAGSQQFKALSEAYAIGLHAVLLFPIVIIGLYLMWSMQFNFGDMLKGSRSDGAPPPDAGVDAADRVLRAAAPAVGREGV
jgi:glycosyltransferase 2 family protein